MQSKKYGILLEKPALYFSNIPTMIETVIKNDLIPIIILQDGIADNNYQNIYNKIKYFRNRYPSLREDNFLIMKDEWSITADRDLWKRKLKEVVYSINNNAFGTSDDSVEDKLFITNLNNIAILENNLILVTDKINSILNDLLNIADVSNIKSITDEKFDPYINLLFRNRDNVEIEYDETLGNEFYLKIKSIPDTKAYIKLEDENYINVINKYDLGKLLYGTFKKSLSIQDKDVDNVIRFLGNNSLKYTFKNSTSSIKNGIINIEIEN